MKTVDMDTIIARMQDAVDVVLTSEHAVNKVAACAFHPDHPEAAPASAVNMRPACLHKHFAWDARIGTSSQYVHAEIAALSAFHGPWRGAHICVTDPFCPNCAKNLAEAGVRTIYIDHKGFQKDFAARNGDEFKSMSMLIAEKAGISVYMVNRKERVIMPIMAQAAQTRPTSSSIEFFDIDDLTLEDAAAMFRQRLGARETWAMGFVKEHDGTPRGLLVFEALPPGITPEDYKIRGTEDLGKYRYPIDPLTRLLLTVRRMGFTWHDKRVVTARIPSSRSLVNALGMDVTHILATTAQSDHDQSGPGAVNLLVDKKILTFTEMP